MRSQPRSPARSRIAAAPPPAHGRPTSRPFAPGSPTAARRWTRSTRSRWSSLKMAAACPQITRSACPPRPAASTTRSPLPIRAQSAARLRPAPRSTPVRSPSRSRRRFSPVQKTGARGAARRSSPSTRRRISRDCASPRSCITRPASHRRRWTATSLSFSNCRTPARPRSTLAISHSAKASCSPSRRALRSRPARFSCSCAIPRNIPRATAAHRFTASIRASSTTPARHSRSRVAWRCSGPLPTAMPRRGRRRRQTPACPSSAPIRLRSVTTPRRGPPPRPRRARVFPSPTATATGCRTIGKPSTRSMIRTATPMATARRISPSSTPARTRWIRHRSLSSPACRRPIPPCSRWNSRRSPRAATPWNIATISRPARG